MSFYILSNILKIFETTVIAAGSHISTTVSGVFFLGIPVMVSIGAYGFSIPQREGLSTEIAILVSLLVGFVVAMIFGFLYIKLSHNSFVVITLTSILAVEAIAYAWQPLTGGGLGIVGIERPGILDSFTGFIIGVGILMLFVLLCEYVVLKSWLGRSLRGMKEKDYLVESLKVSTDHIGVFAVAFSSMTAVIYGILVAWRIGFIDPKIGSILLLLQAITIAILAIKPNVLWVFFATVIVIVLPELLRFFDFPSLVLGHLRNILYAVILIPILLFLNYNSATSKRLV